jgi:hypothetical protein
MAIELPKKEGKLLRYFPEKAQRLQKGVNFCIYLSHP